MKTYTLYLSSDFNKVYGSVEDILTFLDLNLGCVEENNIFELKVILNELILNAIKHGNKCELSKYVKIRTAVLDHGHVVFIIQDEGTGHDYKKAINTANVCCAEDYLADLCDVKETGRGLLIVRNLCDGMKFNKKGNKVIVLKRLRLQKV